MSSETKRYLSLISEHLREHRASVLVGAGFSRNAVKVDESVADSPDWMKLGEIFAHKLSDDPLEQQSLLRQSPLELAWRVENAYGRPELDRLLLNSIRDTDFLPSELHRKLLKLPWNDIFTTNYDTLLEQAAQEHSEQAFAVVTCKEDLIGSSDMTRIIKLHGSFPSHRPFIITSEDYRTYPQKFAPFVNTVQQSMLENTLCLIGFSSDDPNFDKWIGWVRDNLGVENAPYIYLLRHSAPSEEERRRLYNKRIIPVDLSPLAPGKDISAIYEAAFDCLLSRQEDENPGKWDLGQFFKDFTDYSPSHMPDVLGKLKNIHNSYPGWLTAPAERLEMLTSIYSEAARILAQHCAKSTSPSRLELEYLYELDWLREKSLLPPFASDLHLCNQVLKRHPERSDWKCSILLSLLRCFRESGEWDKWETLCSDLEEGQDTLSPDQLQQLRWEKCLLSQTKYQYQELKQLLKNWRTDPGKPVWILRKAGLLAECGELETARSILQEAILDIRRRTDRRSGTDLSLLTLESAMMVLQSHIAQALEYAVRYMDGVDAPDHDEADDRREQLHERYHADWERQNDALAIRLEAPWVPFRMNREEASFNFGSVHTSTYLGDDTEVLRAYRFLRFREESGTPFYIGNVRSGYKAACGAAERLARYSPWLSVLTLVRADEPKRMEQTITRSILSNWTQKDADKFCQFYMDALLRTEPELPSSNRVYKGDFFRLAADVLPQLLSLLCVKCSPAVFDQMLNLLKRLYCSEKSMCYTNADSLARRLISCWPPDKRHELAIELLAFPLFENDFLRRELPDPIAYVPIKRGDIDRKTECGLPEVETLFSQFTDKKGLLPLLERLLHSFCLGLLTAEEKLDLSNILWSSRTVTLPNGWPRTILLQLPAPEGIDVPHLLAQLCSADMERLEGGTLRPLVDKPLLQELRILVLEYPEVFTEEQRAAIFTGACKRLRGLAENLTGGSDIMGYRTYARDQMYEIAHILWIFSATSPARDQSVADTQQMKEILATYEMADIRHCGLRCIWDQSFSSSIDLAQELSACLHSLDELCVKWSMEILALGILRPQLTLMDGAVIRNCIDIMAQQIVWGDPQRLPLALQAVRLAADHMPEVISSDALESVLTGLVRLEQQTQICIEDTIEAASSKGNIRMNAVSLAKAMFKAELFGNRPGVLENWLRIANDPDEFAEIRKAE